MDLEARKCGYSSFVKYFVTKEEKDMNFEARRNEQIEGKWNNMLVYRRYRDLDLWY